MNLFSGLTQVFVFDRWFLRFCSHQQILPLLPLPCQVLLFAHHRYLHSPQVLRVTHRPLWKSSCSCCRRLTVSSVHVCGISSSHPEAHLINVFLFAFSDSDETEFEEDPLLQVLRRQRMWVREQIRYNNVHLICHQITSVKCLLLFYYQYITP